MHLSLSHRMLPLAVAFASLISCGKDEVVPDPTPDPHANTVVALQVSHVFGATPFDLSSTWTDGVGTAIQFTKVRYFVGQPCFLDDANNTVRAFPSKYLLIDASSNAIQTIGELDGHLHTISFGLGLDSVTNHQDPTLAAPPLNDATMHWGWNPAQGYKFLVLEGRYDDDATGTVEADDPEFVFHCATDALRREASVIIHQDATTGGNLVIGLQMDVQVLMQTVDVAASPSVMVPSGAAITLMNNLRNAFSHP